MQILILGGYGHFGGRISRTLANDPDLEIIVAGRSADAAARFIEHSGTAARSMRPLSLDLDASDLATQLRRHAPGLVIHTAGPFQHRDYRVAEAALAIGAHYIDLSDGRDFVTGIHSALNAKARQARCRVISGASSVPGLSAAVIAAYRPRFRHLHSIESGILPGNQTPRGLATTRAILGYVGRPYRILLDGCWQTVHGWQSLRKVPIPGLHGNWYAHCEVPDLSVLPQRYPELRHCDFRAGLELRRMHFGLWLASWLVRAGLIRNLASWAERLISISDHWMKAGTDVGGMYLDMSGDAEDGTPLRLRWIIRAAAGDGPQIPCTAAIVLARKLARGELHGSGATPCLDLFSLADFMEALEGFAIETDVFSMN
ncbi:MAG: saccharopine dehydrogenase NADP-binding domain-containing protein [Xanthomonadaceae bacterium]|jgi:hypothetical protein|nr:saccharopine dehydrogenase NADP-binding domain-containing protein [Xanthomonadaceae bacterium]